MSDSLVNLLLSIGDDELVLGHRHSEWTGFAPHIEEDVAFSSIAQDEIGHAAAYYSIACQTTGGDPDAIALGRDKDGYRNAILCERGNGDWAYSLARHWLYDHADAVRLESLADTAHEELRSLVAKIRREERWHLMHADMWIRRVAAGPVEGRTRLIDALGDGFGEAMGLFEAFELEEEATKEGWLPVPSEEMRAGFVARAGRALDELGLPTEIRATLDDSAEFVASSSGDLIADDRAASEEETPQRNALGGRRGRHTPEFDDLWNDLTYTYRNDPGASW